MTISTSLHRRVKRLEKALKPDPGIAARLHNAQKRWDALSPEQQAMKRRERDIAVLAEPDILGRGIAARLQRAERRAALHRQA